MTGSIRDYTTNFKFIIPEFNIATWHDYIEQNFRSIDALFHNIFGINGFSGMWKSNSQYTAGQVLFVGEDGGSIYEGRLVKVITDTNTGGYSTFSEAIKANPKDYELYADASSAQIFSELARDWANKTDGTVKTSEGVDTGEYSAKKYAQDSQSSATDSEYFKNLAQTSQEIAQSAATDSETSAQNALISEQNSKTSETNAKTSEQNALVSEQNAKSSEDNAKIYETSAANSVVTQTNNFNSYNNQLLSTTSEGVAEINNTKSSNLIEISKELSNALSEINSKTDVLDKTMITNCITYIPQDIKIELNDGTLTLKAGSKVYVPNGFEANGTTPKFDVVVTGSDIVCDGYQTAENRLMMYNNNKVYGGVIDFVYSGDTSTMDSKTPYTYAYFYNTQTNKMYQGNGSSWVEARLSLPLGIATGNSSSQYTSLDQTFNGFGYIGSTIYALPGIKGLKPNGRNEDGTLNNVEITTTKVTTMTNPFGATANANSVMALVVNGTVNVMHRYIESTTAPTTTYTSWYNPKTNKILYAGSTAGVWSEQPSMPVASLNWTHIASPRTNIFTSLVPKLPFRAADRNDSSWLSGLGMPSNKYIDLTLGANNSTYTAPANGWVMIEKVANGAGQRLSLGVSGGQRYTVSSHASGDILSQTVPVIKGGSFYVSYTLGDTTNFFKFIYAQGETE